MPDPDPNLLRLAERAAVFFDWHAHKGTDFQGRWTTVIKAGQTVIRHEHRTEAEARAYVGLQGGSDSPSHRPPLGQTGSVVAIDRTS